MLVAEQMCDFIFMIFRGDKVLDGTLESIQKGYGQDTVRVRTDGGAGALLGLSGIEHVHDLGRYQELRLSADPQEILRSLMARTAVRHFEEKQPSLQDIFLRVAGPDARMPEDQTGEEA